MSLNLNDYDYSFAPDAIALTPLENRAGSRLMVINKAKKEIKHDFFSNLLNYFRDGDILVINNSKVIPARLITKRATGGEQEIFLLNPCATDKPNPYLQNWEVLLGPNQKVKAGTVFNFKNLALTLLNEPNQIPRLAELKSSLNVVDVIHQLGHIPLPSYIKRPDTALDQTRYQTVFAKESGSVAAPTAGLHFTEALLNELKLKGVKVVEITLHVGLGTFLPVKTQNITEHKMHAERFSVSPESAQILREAWVSGTRITAVGTTCARVLETLAHNPNAPLSGTTDLFIYEGYTFKGLNRLITNFHQPKSTLLMLVSALAGRTFILQAYHEAIKNNYRLFSYGDTMLIESENV